LVDEAQALLIEAMGIAEEAVKQTRREYYDRTAGLEEEARARSVRVETKHRETVARYEAELRRWLEEQDVAKRATAELKAELAELKRRVGAL
jgi:hypothetical protein